MHYVLHVLVGKVPLLLYNTGMHATPCSSWPVV